MSFEGYYQILCKNGHYDTVDCYMFENLEWECEICKEKVDWLNQVDLTNGSWDDKGRRIDGYVELQVKYQPHECTCSVCGNKHEVGPITYFVPIGSVEAIDDDDDYDEPYNPDEEILGI